MPDNLKVARVSSLMKQSSLDSERLQNYRPLSNLSFLSVLQEEVVAFNGQPYMDTLGLHDRTEPAYKFIILSDGYMETAGPRQLKLSSSRLHRKRKIHVVNIKLII